MAKAYVEYGRTDEHKSKYDARLDESVLEGNHLFEDEFSVNLGFGTSLDLQSLLQRSSQARTAFRQLTPQERFVLQGHLVLRKTQKVLAGLIGLNECRFKVFLILTLERFTALTAVSFLTREDLAERFQELGCEILTVKCVKRGRKHSWDVKNHPPVQVPTHEVLFLLESGRTWWQIGELYEVYYVGLRQQFEKTIERLEAMPGLMAYVLKVLMKSRVMFAGCQDTALAGSMQEIVGTRTSHQDPEILDQFAINVTAPSLSDLFYPRALNALSPE